MPRKKNPKQSPYYMAILGGLLVEATRSRPDAMPMQKEKEVWFANQLQPGWKGLVEEVPNVGSMIKVSRKILNNPADCSFDISIFNRLCKMLGDYLNFADFYDFESFKRWAGLIPEKLSDGVLAEKGAIRVKQVQLQFKIQEENKRNAAGRALSLLYAIQEKETYLSVGEFSLGEVEERFIVQKNEIEQLEILLGSYPDRVISESFLRYFNASFFYSPHLLRNAVLIPKLWQSAWLMDSYLEKQHHCTDEMLRLRLDLKNNLMKIAWATGKTEETRRLNSELLGLIKESEYRNPNMTTPIFPYFFDYYGYGCCFDAQRFVEFNDFTHRVDCPPREKQAHIWRSLKCMACTKLRCGQYEEVQNALSQMRQECGIVFEDAVNAQNMLGHYHYLMGGSFYHQAKYEDATRNLQLALSFWKQATNDDTVEAGYAFYLLGEIERNAGHHIQYLDLSKKAKEIFANNVKSNACSFDYQQIKNLLFEKSLR